MAKVQILVVEDEIIIVMELLDMLQGMGYAVAAVASSGEEAIAKAAETHPDLALVDIRLQGQIDGVEAAEEIHTRFDIPVIYLTAYADEETLQRAKVTEPYGYILKPFDEGDLHSAIEIALYKHEMERKLKQSEQWLATTLRSIGDAVITTDTSRLVTFMNPVAEALTGWKQEDALGKDLMEVSHITSEGTHRVIGSPAETVIQEGISANLTNYILIARGGEEIPVDVRIAPIRDDKGNITGVVLVFQDITERRRAEAELKRLLTALEHHSTQLQTAAEVSKSASTILDPDELMNQAVNLIQKHFNFYYVGLFLLDEADEYAVLQAGTGEAGQQMLKQGHKLQVGGPSMIGWCTAHGQARIALDVGQETVRFDNLLLPETRSEMALPLISRGRVIGAMTVQSARPAAFSEEDIAVLQTMADQVANAIQNARLFEETRKRMEQTRLLLRVSEATASVPGSTEVMQRIVREVAKALDADMIGAYLLDGMEKKLRAVAGYHIPPERLETFQEFRIPVEGHPFVEEAWESRRTVFTNDGVSPPRFDEETCRLFPAQSVLLAPMTVKDTIVGGLWAVWWEEVRHFTQEEQQLVEGIVRQAAIAIENAQLFEAEAQRQRESEMTARKRAEEALRKQREEYQVIFDSVPALIWYKDTENRILRLNRAAAASMGLSVEEVEGKTAFELHPEEDAAQYYKDDLEVIISGRPKVGIIEPLRTAGEYRWLQTDKIPYRDEKGNIVGVIVCAVDITERQRAEGALKDAELEKETILDSQLEHVIYQDREHRILWPNQAACESVGMTREELMGCYCYKIWPQRTERCEECPVALAMETGQPQEVEKTTPDGRAWFIRGYPVRSADGEIVGGIEITREITERRQVEEALLRLGRAVEQSIDGIAVADMDGNIQFVNPAWAQVHGYSAEELPGKHLSIFHTERQLQEDVLPFNERVMEFGAHQGEVGHVRKDGTTFPTWMTTTLLKDERGNPIGLVGTARDITELKQLEREREELSERRAEQVQASTEITQEIAAAPALDELFRRVVTLIKERFGYYHAQLFRYEPAVNAVVLVAGYGEAGQKMLAEGHCLEMERGVVGTAAATGRPVLATDVTLDADWVPHPHLPETKGELAVPIILRRAQEGETPGQVLGILDVQSDRAGALTDEDELLLEGLCGQIAIAIESTRLRQEMAESLRELERLYHAMSREGWETFQREAGPIGYLFDQTDVIPASDLWVPEVGLAMEQQALVPPTSDSRPMAVTPLSVHGEIIGALGIQDDPQHPLSREELALVESVSEQVALALESARLFEQTQAALNETEALYKSSDRIVRATTIDDVLQALIHSTALQRLDRVGIAFFNRPWEDEMPEEVVIVATWERSGGESRAPVGTRYPLAQFPAIEAVTRDEPTVFRDVATDERVYETLRVLLLDGLGMRSLALWPLVVGEQWIGVLTGQAGTVLEIDEDEVRQIASLTGQAATVIQNIRLFEETQRRAVQLQTAAQVSRAATSILETDQLLTEAVNLIRDRFDLYYVGLFLLDEADEYAVLQAGTGEAGQQMLTQGYKLKVGGSSMIGWCTAHGQARIALDVGQEAVRFDNPLLPGTRSEIALPLISRGEVIGAMTIQSDQSAAFSGKDVAALQTMADQLANAIRNVRLFEAEQKQAVQLAVVNQVARRAASILDMEQLLQEVVTAIQQGFNYHNVALSLLDETAGELEVRAIAGGFADMVPPGYRQAVGTGITGWAVKTGQSLLSNDVSQEPRYIPGFLEEPLAKSELCVPLKLADQVIGVLDAQDIRSNAFDETDLMAMEILADQIAVTIENARLFQETQANLEEITLLHQRYLQEAWDGFMQEESARERTSYMYDQAGVSPAGEVWRPEMGLAVQQGVPIALPDMAGTLQETVEEVGAILQASPTQSALAVPLKVRGKTIGAVDFYESDRVRDWSPEDIAMVEAVANQVALAIENARAYEELQKTAQQLREMDRLKTQFLANMSHELRTPLNSIIGFSRVILKGIDGPINEQQRADLTSIYNNGQHLLGLINDILDISRIEAGKIELIFEPVDLTHIIDGVMSTTVGLVKDKSIKLQREVDPDLPTIRADGTRVRQVILNLLSNAAKFTEEGQIILRAQSAGEQVTISVSDTGIGIPLEHQATIFEEFRQVDASTTRRTGGVGLGLAISRHFVEMHGGCIGVESEPGVGSTFTFTLPIVGPGPLVESDLVDLSIDPSRKLILAVEDDTGAISIYKRYLEKHGYQIVGLNQGEQAVRWALELSPHVIILDVMLPDKDGWTVLEELKSSRETRQIPVIICTINNREEARGLSLGAAAYLVKPILEGDLLQALKRLEEHQQI